MHLKGNNRHLHYSYLYHKSISPYNYIPYKIGTLDIKQPKRVNLFILYFYRVLYSVKPSLMFFHYSLRRYAITTNIANMMITIMCIGMQQFNNNNKQ